MRFDIPSGKPWYEVQSSPCAAQHRRKLASILGNPAFLKCCDHLLLDLNARKLVANMVIELQTIREK